MGSSAREALWIGARDRWTADLAKLVAGLVAEAFSPIDLIPNFIPPDG